MRFKKSLLHAITILILFGILISLILTYAETKIQFVLLTAIVTSVIGPILIRCLGGRFDIFEPLMIANCAFFFMFICRPLADLIIGRTAHLGYTILATFDKTLFLALFGIISFHVGYFSPLSKRLSSLLPNPSIFKPLTATFFAWFFSAIGATLFTIFVNTQDGYQVIPYLLQGRQASNNEIFLSSTGYLYNGIMLWGPASLIFFAIAVVSRQMKMVISYLLLIIPLIIFYGSRGTRSQLLPLAISIPVFWYSWKQKRPNLKIIFLAGFLGLSLLGWIREVREIDTKKNSIYKLKSILFSPFAAMGDLLTGPDTEMFDSMANELLIVPEILPFMNGATIKDIFIRAMPRTLFPNKPLESNDEIVNSLWSKHYSQSRASPCFSLIGVFYADSGFVSVAIGMFLVGLALSASWLWFQKNHKSIMTQILYSMWMPFVVILLRGSIPDTLARMLFSFAPLVILNIVLRINVSCKNTAPMNILGSNKNFIKQP